MQKNSLNLPFLVCFLYHPHPTSVGCGHHSWKFPYLIRFSAPNDHLLKKRGREQRERKRNCQFGSMGKRRKEEGRKGALTRSLSWFISGGTKNGLSIATNSYSNAAACWEEIKSFQGNKWDCCPSVTWLGFPTFNGPGSILATLAKKVPENWLH